MKSPEFDPAWPADVQALYRHDMQEMWDRSIAPEIWNQYQNQLDLYLEIAGPAAPSKRILDVGCAQATLALLLAERGHQVSAMDIRPAFLDYARTRHTHGEIRFVAGNVLELKIEERFDLIFANQIIEHMLYPERVLCRLRELLVPGGRLVITTPNWHYLKNPFPSYRQLGDPSRFEHLQFSADGDGHFFAYRGEELGRVFDDIGLVRVSCRYFETPFISGHMKFRYLQRLIPTPVLKAADGFLLAIPGVGRKFSHQLLVSGYRP